MGRKKLSGLGSNSRRFATIRRPDGGEDRVPAPKDAATYIFVANEDGSWPRTFLAKLLYDITWIEEGTILELQEMRPGHGMGQRMTVKVIEACARVDVYPAGKAQVRRLVLVTEVPDAESRSDDFAQKYGLTKGGEE
jgi:hypothetical protein